MIDAKLQRNPCDHVQYANSHRIHANFTKINGIYLYISIRLARPASRLAQPKIFIFLYLSDGKL